MHRGPGRIYAAQRATQLSPDCARRAILGQLVPHVHLSNALLLLCLLPLQRPQATQHAPITTRGRREESSQPCKREKPGTDAAEAQPIDGLAVGLCVCSTYIYMRVYALYTYAYIDGLAVGLCIWVLRFCAHSMAPCPGFQGAGLRLRAEQKHNYTFKMQRAHAHTQAHKHKHSLSFTHYTLMPSIITAVVFVYTGCNVRKLALAKIGTRSIVGGQETGPAFLQSSSQPWLSLSEILLQPISHPPAMSPNARHTTGNHHRLSAGSTHGHRL